MTRAFHDALAGATRRTLRKLAALALACALAPAAFATTYSNPQNRDIYLFGAPDTTNTGEVFTVSTAQSLSAWDFYAISGFAGNLALTVAAWNGSRAAGPALYVGSGAYDGNGNATLAFDGIDTNLAAGTYIAYLTVAGVADPVSNVGLFGSTGNAAIGDGLRFQNTNGVDPLTLDSQWHAWQPAYDLAFTATFGATIPPVTPVPEPGSAALILAALGLGSIVAHRRLGSS